MNFYTTPGSYFKFSDDSTENTYSRISTIRDIAKDEKTTTSNQPPKITVRTRTSNIDYRKGGTHNGW